MVRLIEKQKITIPDFAKKIVEALNVINSQDGDDVKLMESKEIHFANSETKTVIEESIRGADLYIIQDVENSSNGYSVDENLRALKTAIDADMVKTLMGSVS